MLLSWRPVFFAFVHKTQITKFTMYFNSVLDCWTTQSAGAAPGILICGSKNSRGLAGRRTLHHPDKVTGSARLPQVPQIDAGGPDPGPPSLGVRTQDPRHWGVRTQEPRPPPPCSVAFLRISIKATSQYYVRRCDIIVTELVAWSVCRSVTLLSVGKAAEPIEMPFGLRTRVG